MMLRKKNQFIEIDDAKVIDTFARSPLFADNTKGERLRLSLFISMPEPLGLGSSIPDFKELLKVENLWKERVSYPR